MCFPWRTSILLYLPNERWKCFQNVSICTVHWTTQEKQWMRSTENGRKRIEKNTLKTKQTIDDSVFMIYYFFSKTQAKYKRKTAESRTHTHRHKHTSSRSFANTIPGFFLRWMLSFIFCKIGYNFNGKKSMFCILCFGRNSAWYINMVLVFCWHLPGFSLLTKNAMWMRDTKTIEIQRIEKKKPECNNESPHWKRLHSAKCN